MKKPLLILLCLSLLFSCGDGKMEGNCVSGDCANGYGTYTLSNGEKYVGKWKDSMKSGQGAYTLPAVGEKYVGEWRSGKMHGYGTYTYPNGDKYVGRWIRDKENGQGTYTFGKGKFRGDKYVGGYSGGERHGLGKYTTANGRIWSGSWYQGKKGPGFWKN